MGETGSSNNFWMKTPEFFNYARELFTGCPLEISAYKMCCLSYLQGVCQSIMKSSYLRRSDDLCHASQPAKSARIQQAIIVFRIPIRGELAWALCCSLPVSYVAFNIIFLLKSMALMARLVFRKFSGHYSTKLTSPSLLTVSKFSGSMDIE